MNESHCGRCQHYSRASIEVWQYPNRGVCTSRLDEIKGVLRMRTDGPLKANCYHAKDEDLRNGRLFDEEGQ
jgi:hypothetical protein